MASSSFLIQNITNAVNRLFPKCGPGPIQRVVARTVVVNSHNLLMKPIVSLQVHTTPSHHFSSSIDKDDIFISINHSGEIDSFINTYSTNYFGGVHLFFYFLEINNDSLLICYSLIMKYRKNKRKR